MAPGKPDALGIGAVGLTDAFGRVHAGPVVGGAVCRGLAAMRRVTATYRLQLNVGFTFADAQARWSPISRRSVSSHLLSVADLRGTLRGRSMATTSSTEQCISPELGGEAGFRDARLRPLRQAGPRHRPRHRAEPLWRPRQRKLGSGWRCSSTGGRHRSARGCSISTWSCSDPDPLSAVCWGVRPRRVFFARGEIAIETREAKADSGLARVAARYFDQALPASAGRAGRGNWWLADLSRRRNIGVSPTGILAARESDTIGASSTSPDLDRACASRTRRCSSMCIACPWRS